MDLKTVTEKIDAIRKEADRVRKVVDTILNYASEIPFLGKLLGSYVSVIRLAVDGLDDAIDALDDSLDKAAKAAKAPQSSSIVTPPPGDPKAYDAGG